MFQILALSCTQAQPFRKLLLLPQVQLFFLINKIELKLLGSQTFFIIDTGSNVVKRVKKTKPHNISTTLALQAWV